jgi:anaerobic magnesium-protoporphyrin IX monomethyl ester cyclase
VVIQGTAGQLHQQAVVGIIPQHPAHQGIELAVVEMLRLPLQIAIDPHRRRIKAFLFDAPADGGIGPQGQLLPLSRIVRRRQQSAGKTRRQKSRYGLGRPAAEAAGQLPQGGEAVAARILAHGRGTGNGEQFAARRQGNEFVLPGQPHPGAVHAHQQQIRVFKNLAGGIGHHGQNGLAGFHGTGPFCEISLYAIAEDSTAAEPMPASPGAGRNLPFAAGRLSAMLCAMRVLLATLHSKFVHASLALPLLAGFCRASQRQLLIREYTVHEPKEAVLAAILAENPDVVALSVYIWNRRASLELADALAVAKPDLRIVVGGPEVSFDGPDLFARHPGLSALIRGEGELPLRDLLTAWQEQRPPADIPRLTWRSENRVVENPDGPTLATLDEIPSPFALELVDLSRGLVYLETSRGCPFRCAFCMSALDPRVRSYSMARIEADLSLLMEREVPCVKLVDRTFNYDAERARHIFSFILQHNRRSRFHFEIGAQLLDEATLQLLEKAPAGLFQFEIGVQSTRADTLAAIRRSTDLDVLFENVRRLRRADNIPLHLDLIAGLPGENYGEFCLSIDRLLDLRPHHLQLEPVKLLPGAPLRRQAAQFGLRHDPHPPYTVLGTPELSFADLERLRGMGRMLDLTWNAGRLRPFSISWRASASPRLPLWSNWRITGTFTNWTAGPCPSVSCSNSSGYSSWTATTPTTVLSCDPAWPVISPFANAARRIGFPNSSIWRCIPMRLNRARPSSRQKPNASKARASNCSI